MAEYSGFFNCSEGMEDRVYDADDFANFFRLFLQNGVFAYSFTSLQVVPKSERTVTLKKGAALIDGYWYILDADMEFEISQNSTSSSRMTTIVCNLNKASKRIQAQTIDNPSYSGLPRNDGVNVDLVLCRITCKPSFTVIESTDIEDMRTDQDFCGWVTSILETTDLDALYTDIKNSFNTWFEEIKGKLGEDPATSLQQQINEIVNTKVNSVSELDGVDEQGRFVDALAVKALARDFVVEENVSDVSSMYRKWNSGLLEVWTSSLYAVPVNIAWGSCYRTASLTGKMYPVQFKEVPQVIATVKTDVNDAGWLVERQGERTNQAPDYYVVRPDQIGFSAKFYVSTYSTGRWK